MPLRFFTTTRTGEIQSRLANDVGGVQTVVTDTASNVLANVVTIISTLIAMLILSVQLTLLSLVLMPLFLWLTVKVGRARREVSSTTQKTLADITSITEETLSVSGILLSKSFGRQRHEIGRFEEENQRLTGLQIRQTMIGRSFFAVVGTFFSITPALVYLVAGGCCTNGGDINSGDVVAFTTLQSRLFFPIGSMLQVSTDVQARSRCSTASSSTSTWTHEIAGRARRRASRARERARRGCGSTTSASGTKSPVERTTPVSPTDVDDRQRDAAGVDAGRRLLDDRPGQLAALVGPSGAGKTTITYLVPRLYDVQQGSRVGSTASTCATSRSNRSATSIGVVTQETYLFHTTIRRNLMYGRPDATQEEMEAAASGQHPRSDRGAARGLRHGGGRARLQAVRGREAAPRDRPRDPEGPSHPDPGRGHLVARHHLGAAGAGGAGAPDGGPDHDRHRPPPVHDPRAPT